MPINKKPIYDKQTKTYSLKIGRIEAVIGDEKVSDKILPRLKLKVWDNECNLSVGLVTDETEKDSAVIEEKDDAISWRKGNTEAKFYPLDATEQYEEGGYEFEVVLHERPKSNIVEFTLTSKGLQFYLVPELKREDIYQPENVIGSYIAYHYSQRSNIKNNEDGKKYGTGAAFQIYRPKIIDSNGDWVWGKLYINSESQILSIAIDKNWLDRAVYPVRVDPTFGNDTVTTGLILPSDTGYYMTKFTCPGYGIPTAITARFAAYGGDPDVWMCIYSDLNNYPHELIGVSQKLSDIEEYSYTYPLLNIPLTAMGEVRGGREYWLGLFSTNGRVIILSDIQEDQIDLLVCLDSDASTPASVFPAENELDSLMRSPYILGVLCEYESRTDPTVETSTVTNIDHESADLLGNLIDIGEESSVGVYFEYRKVGGSTWSSTTIQEMTSTGTFNDGVTSLDSNTEYEFRSVVEWDLGLETYYGDISTFTTLMPPLTLSGEKIGEVFSLSWEAI